MHQAAADAAFLQQHAANVALAMGADYVPPPSGSWERQLLQEARAEAALFKAPPAVPSEPALEPSSPPPSWLSQAVEASEARRHAKPEVPACAP